MRIKWLGLAALWLLMGFTTVPAQATLPLAWNQIPVSEKEKADLRALAQGGDASAAAKLGRIYEYWAGTSPDYIESARWYQMAVDNGDAYAKADLERLATFSATHAELYVRAQTGDGQSLYEFASHGPHNATGLAGDAPAVHWALKAAQAGFPRAEGEVGFLYFRANYLRRGGGDNEVRLPYIPFTVERLDFEGEDAAHDLDQALFWLQKAADDGDESFLRELGLAYAISGPTRDVTKASLWLHRARDPRAMNDAPGCAFDFTGGLHELPVGYDGKTLVDYDGPPDYAAAYKCYLDVSHFYPAASYFLGLMDHRGLGTVRNNILAVKRLSQIAPGNGYGPEALYELSRLYGDSTRIRRNPVKAYVLLIRAIDGYEGGHPSVIYLCGAPPFYGDVRQARARGAALRGMGKRAKTLYGGLSVTQKRAANAQPAAVGLHPNAVQKKGLMMPPTVIPCD